MERERERDMERERNKRNETCLEKVEIAIVPPVLKGCVSNPVANMKV